MESDTGASIANPTPEDDGHHEERCYALLAAAGDLVVTTDPAGSWKSVAPLAGEFLGYESSAMLGKHLVDFAPDEDHEAIRRQFQATAQGAVADATHRVVCADGSTAHIDATTVPVRDATTGEVVEILFVARDGTRFRRLEAERNDAVAALEAANDSKSQFLANMSHQIRTPMNAILGMTELALGTQLTAEQQEYLETTRKSVEGLITLVNDILDLSKIEAGQLELDSVLFSLHDTIEDTIRRLAVEAASRGLRLEQSIGDSVPDLVIGDPGRLRQVLSNFVDNAIQFTDDGGVDISVRMTESDGDGVSLHFTIEDSGIGIPSDQISHIFEAFVRGEGPAVRHERGTGLGLALASQIVSLMSGEVWLESQVEQGTTIHFTVRVRQLLGATEVTPAAQSDADQLVVAVVSSDEAARRNLAAVLQTMRALPIAFGSAHSLVSALESGVQADVPNAVIIAGADDELEVCDELIAAGGVAARIPLVVAPSIGERGDAARFRSLGVRGYIPRPIAPAELSDLLRAAIAMPTDQVGMEIITRHWLRERRPELTVLVADDSATNRMLAARLLEKRGHKSVQVENGRQAVEAVMKHEFDVVLMDLQMPQLDGLAATEEIRATEAGEHRLPIVALTAHATESAKKRCEAAGMDAYIAKPFVADELYSTIERLARGGATTEPVVASASINGELALQRVEGDGAFYAEIAEIFLAELPNSLGSLRTAVEAGDFAAAARCAHRLSGNMGSLGAETGYDLAERLKRCAQAGDEAGVAAAWAAFVDELDRIGAELNVAIATKGASLSA